MEEYRSVREIEIKDGALTALIDPLGAQVKELWYGSIRVGRDGITVGRYANRIRGAAFSLGGKTYRLSANESGNCLHGGEEGFDKRLWSVEDGEGSSAAPGAERKSVCLSLIAEDGDQGFPGRLAVTVSFTAENGSLIIDYCAVSDADTVLNLTNHTYFNLNGGGSAEDHLLSINADRITETGGTLIPTGRFTDVEGTRFDYRTERRFEAPHDENYVLCGTGFRKAASLKGTKSGICLEVFTDQPGIQLYNTNDAVCLETQHFADSPNHPAFPTTLLKAGEEFRSRTVYAFSTSQRKQNTEDNNMTRTFRAPGRTELGGNHTDHQHGKVLAAGIDLYITAEAEKTDGKIVKIASLGYPDLTVDLSDLEPVKSEQNRSESLVRGIAARISQLGYNIGGFNAEMKSEVLSGSGLSSSAAYEVLIGRIFNEFYCGGQLSDVQIAQIGQYAENVYFGKPCGLMDQMACSVGNIVAIDFKDPENPVIEQIDRRFEDFGYALCIIDTRTEHADLTADYASIPADMCAAAKFFGKEVLRDVPEDEFYAYMRGQSGPAANGSEEDLTDLQKSRAMHFFSENKRAGRLAEALKAGDFTRYLDLINQSARSSEELLKNIVPQSHPDSTQYAECIELARKIMAGKGAVRVHGGGFAGTIQAYVPLEEKDAFREKMESVLGKGTCHYLKISR